MWQAIQVTHAVWASVSCTAVFNYTINSTGCTSKFSNFRFSCSVHLGVSKEQHLGHDHSCSFPSQQIFQLYSVMLCFLNSLIHSWGKQDIMQGSMRSFSVRLNNAVCPCCLICIHSSSAFVIAAAEEQMQSNPVTLFPAMQTCQEVVVPGTAFAGMSPWGKGPRVPWWHCRIPMFSPVPVMALWTVF